jgi:uncharacterized damage-inducible protein DinB
MTGHSFIERSRYYLAREYPAKIRIAVESLSDEIIWRRPGEDSNSIGNLLLHLSGNIRQWIVGGVGGAQTDRDRASEFAARGGVTGKELLALLEQAAADADGVLAGLSDADLSEPRTIQGRETTVIGAIYHVVEHFSMHAGQILMVAKIFAPGSVKFYEDAGGVAVPLWGGREGMS